MIPQLQSISHLLILHGLASHARNLTIHHGLWRWIPGLDPFVSGNARANTWAPLTRLLCHKEIAYVAQWLVWQTRMRDDAATFVVLSWLWLTVSQITSNEWWRWWTHHSILSKLSSLVTHPIQSVQVALENNEAVIRPVNSHTSPRMVSDLN